MSNSVVILNVYLGSLKFEPQSNVKHRGVIVFFSNGMSTGFIKCHNINATHVLNLPVFLPYSYTCLCMFKKYIVLSLLVFPLYLFDLLILNKIILF